MNGKGRKRTSTVACNNETHHAEVESGDCTKTEMSCDDKRQKISEQYYLKKILNEASLSPKQRHFFIQGALINENLTITDEEWAELLFGHATSIDYIGADELYNSMPSEIAQRPLIQKVWSIAKLIEPFSRLRTSSGFGTAVGFASSIGFGTTNGVSGCGFNNLCSNGFGTTTEGIARGFASSNGVGKTNVGVGFGNGFGMSFSTKQKCIAEALKKVREADFEQPILKDYVTEFKKRIIAMQLREMFGINVSVQAFASLLGFNDISMAMPEIMDILSSVEWELNSGIVNTTGLKEGTIEKFINTTYYSYIQI